MKKKLFSAVILVTLLVSVLPSLPVMAPSSDLVGLWHFDEGIGSTASDSSGTGNDGTLSGGKFGNALSFDGVNDYVYVNGSPSPLSGMLQLTLEAWIYVKSYPGSYGAIVTKWYQSTSYDTYGLWIGSNKKLVGALGPQIEGGFVGTNDVTLNAWHYVALVYNGLAGNAELYLDGNLEATKTGVHGNLNSKDNPLLLGADYYGIVVSPYEWRFFNGKIDEVRISNTPHTITTPPPLTAFTVEGDTIALWHLDESVGTIVTDLKSSYQGTLYDATWAGPVWTNEAKFGGWALSFDGVDDYVTVPDSVSLDLTEQTIETWVKIRTLKYYNAIVVKGLDGAENYESLAGYPSLGAIVSAITFTDNSRYWLNTGNVITANAWHHVVVTYKPGEWRIYVDGDKKAERTDVSKAPKSNALPLWIGNEQGTSGRSTDGIIDEVRIYNIALSPEVVAAHSRLNYEPPTVEAGGPYTGDEGSPIIFTASGSDPDGNALQYHWDFDNDGVYDTDWSSSPTATYTWNDDHSGTVTVEVSDGDFTDTDTALVTVNNVAPEITHLTGPTDLVKVSVETSVTVTFTDPGTLDTHTAEVDWGDGSPIIQVVTSPVELKHTYTSSNVYAVSVTIKDDDNGLDTEIFEFIVVYDPNGGFVTGGGWINSPAGAYAADSTLAGKATFGFVSKYQKGANVPTGNTEFQFHTAGMNFKSKSYDWLVVAGTKAMYKGEGTINGVGNFGFMLTAKDGGSKGADTFRIKIWDKNNGDAIVYDNGLGASDTSDPTTVIAGGSIVVHK